MFKLIYDTTRKFLWDDAYASQQLRALAFFLGWALNTGVIPIAVINEKLGDYAWFAGGIIQALALFVRSGDKNDQEIKP